MADFHSATRLYGTPSSCKNSAEKQVSSSQVSSTQVAPGCWLQRYHHRAKASPSTSNNRLEKPVKAMDLLTKRKVSNGVSEPEDPDIHSPPG